MSKSRGYLTRPRTKVYDCNYNIGQNYYKPTLDNLDRKYGKPTISEPATNGALSALRASLEREKVELPSLIAKRTASRDLEDDEFFSETPRRNNAALLGEFDSIFENRPKLSIRAERSSKQALRAIEDDVDEDLSASIKKLRASRASAADDFEEEFTSRKPALRSKLDLANKIIDSVGISERSRAAADEGHIVAKRRVVKVTTSADNIGDDQSLTRWTSLNSEGRRRHALDEEPDTPGQIAAAARARKSRARLEDLETEMQELSDKSAAREKRVRDLRAFLKDTEASSTAESVQSTVKVRSSTKAEKKIVSF